MRTSTLDNLPTVFGTTLAVVLLATTGVSEAATIASKWKSNAAGVCQSSFSSGAGAVIRARPLAVQNEGANTAFVTCSLPYNDDGGLELPSGPVALGVRLVNNLASAQMVSCTLVAGTLPDTPEFIAKTISVPANSSIILRFVPTDLAGGAQTEIPAPNLSCGLPPSTGIGNVFYFYNRQIGT